MYFNINNCSETAHQLTVAKSQCVHLSYRSTISCLCFFMFCWPCVLV